ncbi:hypothetical protein M422DRAFT_35449 [Sphaerobolus stellatus SS14]|uniref:tRNA-dihydrouridine(47) synthase [NAD(P)(+)] n=1 Tax=Sphaerobolus stellatus (strain SS14) TaxID=990650 RepID=A0A0C9UFI2_SPHS4|nr:hypothetical protein M422DRAFT_35449 [Sphaerobolus stellatus SS14]
MAAVETRRALPPGVAPVKPEYIISFRPTTLPDDDSAEGSTNQSVERASALNDAAHAGEKREADADADAEEGDDTEPPVKKQKLSGAQRKRLAREEKKAKRGANKNRKFGMVHEEVELCWKVAMGETCEFAEKCRFTHAIKSYLSTKSRDLKIPPSSALTASPPYVTPLESGDVDPEYTSIDFTTKCPVFEEQGVCRAGLKCRFLGGHVKKTEEGGIQVVTDPEREQQLKDSTQELNYPRPGLFKEIRTKKYPTPVTDEYLKALQDKQRDNEKKEKELKAENDAAPATATPLTDAETVEEQEGNTVSSTTAESDVKPSKPNGTPSQPFDQSQDDSPDVPLRPVEKKRLHWSGKTYLAPLTTAGNLPFRRLCVSFGADITCGEMGLASSFLNASREEFSLIRRHPSEKIFGIQLAGNKPSTLVPSAEMLAKEFGSNLDFVDLNCGCPIDLVFKNGAGSALLDQPSKLGKILIGMNRALGEIPLTVKIRTGVRDGRNTAHRLMPRVGKEWGASAITIHGRTRQQRYTKLANWDYIKHCVETLRTSAADDDLPPIPIFGGGDCYSSQSYWEAVDNTGVDGVMVARGALIKPWIFTEIKEKREWDISSRERLDIIKQYAEYGLNHFGADTAGVNTTRRYLCEALSFQYRYIPIGLLERLPGKMNERPPVYRGRDELETMLGSGDSRTWVKLSEMFLGPAPQNWSFTPKHKSNAYGDEEAQG